VLFVDSSATPGSRRMLELYSYSSILAEIHLLPAGIIRELLHVHPLTGKALVNKFPRRQILGRQSVARLRNNRGGCVFYVVRATPSAGNGLVNSQLSRNLCFLCGLLHATVELCFLRYPCRGHITRVHLQLRRVFGWVPRFQGDWTRNGKKTS
jgi:hypothetical protein